MDYSEEQLKPLYAVRTTQRRYALASRPGDQRLLEDSGTRVILVEATDDADAELQLIIARLQAVPGKRFRFVDGTEWTGEEAAREVQEDTERGRYFKRLEERTLQLAREAQARGEF